MVAPKLPLKSRPAPPWWEQELPKRVLITGYDYDLFVVPDDHLHLDGAFAITYFETGSIYISKGHSLVRFLNFVWHELTHAINEVNSLEDGDDEEDYATRHGEAWPTFFLLNPAFFAWFTKAITTLQKEHGIVWKPKRNSK